MTTTETQKLDKEGYILLPSTWTESGWTFNYHKHVEDDWHIYIRTKTNGEGRKHYELVRLTTQEEFNFKGKIIPKKWHYPSTSQFGKLGFDCISEQRALFIYDQLKERQEEREEKKDIKVMFPSKKPFSIKDLEKLNPELSYANIYNKVKDLLLLAKLKVHGEKENKIGKPSKIYILT